MGTTHALSGAAAFLVAAPQVFPDAGPAEIAAGAAIAAGFALLPDVDHPTATITNRLPLGGLVARVVGAVSGGHRQGTHSLLAAGMLAALAFGLPAALPDDRAPYALAVLAYFGAVFGVGSSHGQSETAFGASPPTASLLSSPQPSPPSTSLRQPLR